jgi:hypothetical protein
MRELVINPEAAKRRREVRREVVKSESKKKRQRLTASFNFNLSSASDSHVGRCLLIVFCTVVGEMDNWSAILRTLTFAACICMMFFVSGCGLMTCPGCRPIFLPFALAASSPDNTRSRSRLRSNSARPLKMESINFPRLVDKSKSKPLGASIETLWSASS